MFIGGSLVLKAPSIAFPSVPVFQSSPMHMYLGLNTTLMYLYLK